MFANKFGEARARSCGFARARKLAKEVCARGGGDSLVERQTSGLPVLAVVFQAPCARGRHH